MENERCIIHTHLTYDQPPTLKNVIDALEIVNLSINDVNAEIRNLNRNQVKKYPVIVEKVENGSIIFDLLVQFAIDVAVDLVVYAIKKRIADKPKKYRKIKVKSYKKITKNGTENITESEIEITIENDNGKKGT